MDKIHFRDLISARFLFLCAALAVLVGCAHNPKAGGSTKVEKDLACRIVEKLYVEEEWVTCSDITIRRNGDYRRRDFEATKPPSLRSQATGHLPHTLLDPLLSSSRQFPQVDGIPVYELLLDDSRPQEPPAVHAVREFVALHQGVR